MYASLFTVPICPEGNEQKVLGFEAEGTYFTTSVPGDDNAMMPENALSGSDTRLDYAFSGR